MDFQTIVEDIKNLKIQGAQNVAKAGVKALQIVAHDIRNKTKVTQIHDLSKTKQILFNTRPTEPGMRNALNYVLNNIETTDDIYTEIVKRTKEVNQHFDIVKKKIAQIGSKKIKNGMITLMLMTLMVDMGAHWILLIQMTKY